MEEFRDWATWDAEHPYVPVADVKSFRDIPAAMGMHVSGSEAQDAHPENYEPNKGFGSHLAEGKTETRLGTDNEGRPILYDVKATDFNKMDGTAAEKLRQHDGGGMGSLTPDDKTLINVRDPDSERLAPLFRTMSEDEYQGALKSGHIQSDGRMNLAGDEGTVASARSTGTFYMVPGANRVVKIEQGPKDGWKTDPRDGYQKTSQPIPMSRVSMVSPKLNYTKTGYDPDVETKSALGAHVRRWNEERDWTQWDLEHPYVPEGKGDHQWVHYDPETPKSTVTIATGSNITTFTKMEDPDKRAIELWQASYPGNSLVQGAMRNISEGGPGFTADDINRFQSGDLTGLPFTDPKAQDQVEKFMGQTIGSHQADLITTDEPYTADDLAKDINASAEYMMHSTETAPRSTDNLFRSVVGPADDTWEHPNDTVFKEGSTITLSPQSFSSDPSITEEMIPYARQLTGNDEAKAYTIEIQKGDGNAFTLPKVQGSAMKESLVGGQFKVEKVTVPDPGKMGLYSKMDNVHVKLVQVK